MDAPAPVKIPAPTGAPRPSMTLQVHPTTGGHFAVDVEEEATVETLKCKIARQLRLPKERLSLLCRETHLRRGTLRENGVTSGCKLTLLPVVESGLMSQRQDQTLIQALQNLTEAQVDNFLNGKQPLTLALRLGNHMVFVQLQLAGSPAGHQQQNNHRVNTATQTCQGGNERLRGANGSRTTSSPTTPKMAATSRRSATPPCIVRMPTQPRCPRSQCPVHGKPVCLSAADQSHLQQQHHHHHHHPHHPHPMSMTPASSPTSPSPPSSPSSPHHHQHVWPPRSSGAFIESVHQHSPGVFSGTFSGILGAAVQDQQGRPRREISTIAHILNDLLQAAPFYKQHLSTLCCQHRGSRHREANNKTSQYRAHPGKGAAVPPPHRDHRRQDLFVENDHTRSKMAHLQTMMRERQARRQARREMQGPYMPVHRTASAQAAALSIPEKTPLECGNKERAMTDNCYPSLKQDFLAV